MTSRLHKIGFWGLIAIYIAWLFSPLFLPTGSPLLILNMFNNEELPKNFRIDKELQSSGSAQFSSNALKKILHEIPKEKTIIVDLRQECHGFFDGTAISWYSPRDWANLGKSSSDIAAEEKIRLQDAENQGLIYVYKSRKFPLLFYVSKAFTESRLASDFNIGYHRFYVADHMKPDRETVNQFVAFIQQLPKDVWLHFHCAAGEGRTTTFMAMHAMMKTASALTYEEILKRQHAIGGIDLLSSKETEDWKTPYVKERQEFLTEFYRYCRENPSFERPF